MDSAGKSDVQSATEGKALDETSTSAQPHRVWHRRRWIRVSIVGATILILFVACLPSLLSMTPVRNTLIKWLAGPHVEITTQAASFGWFTPLRIEGLGIHQLEAGNHIDVGKIEVQKPLLTLLFDAPKLGTVTIEQLRLDLVPTRMPNSQPSPPNASNRNASRTTFRAEVHDAALVLRDKVGEAPVVDLGGFDLMLDVQDGVAGRVLFVDPTDLLRQQELSRDLCHRGLQLIAPVLANATHVDGRVSLRLDKLRVPLDQRSDSLSGVEVDGHLVMHRVSAGLQNPVLIEVARSLSRLLRAPLPSQVKLADEADVHFWMADARVFHEGLRFGLPEISPDLVLHTKGSVALDHSLDLLVDVPLPLDRIHDGPILRMLSERPLQLQVRGTLEKPIVSLPADRPWYRELAQRLANPTNTNTTEVDSTGSALEGVEALQGAVLESLGTLLERRRQQRAESAESSDPGRANSPVAAPNDRPAPKPLLDRLRDRRNRNAPNDEKTR
jgi:hypothetical protein